VDVKPIDGLEHVPYAEVWLEAVGEQVLAEAFAAAAAIGKPGLEVWTTTKTPDVAEYLAAHGFEEHRRYVISELDTRFAPDPGPPAHELVTVAERPELGPELHELARVAHADQPGRAGTDIGDGWLEWGFRANPAESYFVALDGDRVLAYGYLTRREDVWWHGFLAVARAARGRGLAGSIKRAQIRYAKEHEIAELRTATEARLAGLRDLNRRLGYVPLYDEIVLRSPALLPPPYPAPAVPP
jgi:GNAT superfamily N-acetyltransferase